MGGSADRRVVVVTGGGAGIGAAVAEALGRTGAFVVTVDPLVTLDGSEQLPPPEETTAGRIVAAGGAARASSVSVTDGDGIAELFRGLVDEFGRLDGVINVAGITRPSSFASGTEEDWAGVLSVHLDGYLNVLRAALPLMAAAGHGRILGVTSGSGWRPADTGAYGCAKRAVAALTWQLGREAPPGVVVNAMSPIAVTRMVTAAMERMAAMRSPKPDVRAESKGGGSSTTGGLSLGSMPTPDQLGPFGAYLVGDDVGWCTGRIFFAGGPEVALVEEPHLLEAVRTDDLPSLPAAVESFGAGALAPAEAAQASTGGSNPRFGSIFDGTAPPPSSTDLRSCVVVSTRPAEIDAVTRALGVRGVTCEIVDPGDVGPGFAGAAAGLAAAEERSGAFGAVVLALDATAAGAPSGGWEGVLAEHGDLAGGIHRDAAWARAVSDLAVASDRPVRLITLTDASTSGGRSRAQAVAQHARSSRGATKERVAAFAVGVESPDLRDLSAAGELAAHLACHADAAALSGAELAVGRGWIGLRSHPRPTGSIAFGGPAIPDWFDDALRSIAAAEEVR